jgi:hypothetical protein
MANIFNYSVATNTGKGFITVQEGIDFSIQSFPGNVYVCADCPASIAWIARVSGASKTLSEAQSIVDTAIAAQQVEWDNQTDTEKEVAEATGGGRPTAIVLPSVPDLDTEATASGLTLTYDGHRHGWSLV